MILVIGIASLVLAFGAAVGLVICVALVAVADRIVYPRQRLPVARLYGRSYGQVRQRLRVIDVYELRSRK